MRKEAKASSLLPEGAPRPGPQLPGLAGSRTGSQRILHYADNTLAKRRYFAGDDFTAADIIMGFGLTTMRAFAKRELTDHPNIRAYLGRIGERPAYRRAMQKADPQMEPLLS